MSTEQERFWAGEFGDAYTDRNAERFFPSSIALFSKILQRTQGISSVIEFGANRGDNLRALRVLRPDLAIAGVEINTKAYGLLATIPGIKAVNVSILDYQPPTEFDLVLIRGVLMHINPDFLPKVYETMVRTARRYILLCEYYNPTPVEVRYRGHSGKLFKRDYAGEMLDRFSLRLVDYGFVYHRDQFPVDDQTWFLLEKI